MIFFNSGKCNQLSANGKTKQNYCDDIRVETLTSGLLEGEVHPRDSMNSLFSKVKAREL